MMGLESTVTREFMIRAALHLVAPIGARQFHRFPPPHICMIRRVAIECRTAAEVSVYCKEASMNPTSVALGYLIAGGVLVPLILHFFKTRFDWIDIGLAAVGGALASLIPTVGGIASYAAMLGILYWRLGKDQLFPGVIVAVSVARLALIPLFLLIKTRA
jgi:hypothetical protein